MGAKTSKEQLKNKNITEIKESVAVTKKKKEEQLNEKVQSLTFSKSGMINKKDDKFELYYKFGQSLAKKSKSEFRKCRSKHT
jgi:hypothetical protein